MAFSLTISTLLAGSTIYTFFAYFSCRSYVKVSLNFVVIPHRSSEHVSTYHVRYNYTIYMRVGVGEMVVYNRETVQQFYGLAFAHTANYRVLPIVPRPFEESV